MKKTPGDIIIPHKCTKNHDHMLYCSWNMAHDRCNCCFSFWAIFCPFTSVTAQRYHHFTQVYQKSRSYAILFLRHGTWWMRLLLLILGYLLPFYSRNSPKISLFYKIVPKTMIICYTVPEIWRVMYLIATFHFGLFFALLP